MNSSKLCDLILEYSLIFAFTFNNLFLIFIQIVIDPIYYEIISKEVSFLFFSFLSIILWLLILLFIGNFRTEKEILNSNPSFQDKIINFFVRKNIKSLIITLKDNNVKYALLLSILGGFIGMFSLGNLYNKLYKRFLVQFGSGIIIMLLSLIMVYNYPLTSNLAENIFYHIVYFPSFIVLHVIYYIITVNDTYECALSIKKNVSLPPLLDKDILYILIMPCAIFLLTIYHIYHPH